MDGRVIVYGICDDEDDAPTVTTGFPGSRIRVVATTAAAGAEEDLSQIRYAVVPTTATTARRLVVACVRGCADSSPDSFRLTWRRSAATSAML